MTDWMRDPAVSIALLRIAVGLSFAKGLVTKLSVVLVGGFVPLPRDLGPVARGDSTHRGQSSQVTAR